MKFGEALPQRSVPEWLPYNLDYNEIKQLIKRYTTGRPLVRTPEAKTDFEDEFFDVLVDQLGRIDLFVKSKAGEVDRRIGKCILFRVSRKHEGAVRCKRQVTALRRRDAEDVISPGSRRPGRSAKVEQEVERVSYEVQCLSRFVNVQRTGFFKLLKKYKKWTGSSHLLSRFLPILRSPTAFHRVDFEKNVLELSELLSAIRSGLDLPSTPVPVLAQPKWIRNDEPVSPQRHPLSIDAALSQRAISTTEGRAYLDTALATSTRESSGGGRATFWVHYDHLIELQVLLLRYLTLQTSPIYDDPPMPPTRKDPLGTLWKDDEIAVVLLDDLDSFSDVQSSATVAEVVKACSRTAGQIRWCCRDSDAVAVVSNTSASRLGKVGTYSGDKLEVKMKRKHIEELLDTGSISPKTGTNDHVTGDESEHDVEKLKKWLRENKNINPLVKLLMKRIRFADTTGVWALLDWDITMKRVYQGTSWMSGPEEDEREFGSGDKGGLDFPHAILEVQWEGQNIPGFLSELETSHMVENVRGFSLDVHAVSVLCQPKNMTPPFWLAALKRDIRKTPVHTPRHSRRSSSHLVFTSASSKNTSIETSATAAHDFTDGFDSSTTAFSRTDTGPVVLPNKKYARTKSTLSIEPIGGERYWSEFNDGDDSEEPYTILVKRRPSSDDGYDGDEDLTLSAFIRKGFVSTGHKFRALFAGSHAFPTERSPLLRKPRIPSSESSSEIDVEVGILSTSPVGHAHRDTFSGPAASCGPLSPAYLFCLGSSVIILVLTLILALSSSSAQHKRKWRKGQFKLDLEVCGAVLAALVFASVGLVVFLRSRSRAGLLHQTVIWISFGAVCIGSGVVLAMVGNREVGN